MEDYHPALEYFGRSLTERGRDWSIRDYDLRVRKALEKPDYRYAQFIRSLTPEQTDALRRMTIDTIDTTLHNIMFMFEEYRDIHIGVDLKDESINDIREVATGELQGYIFMWAEDFSSEPLSDL